VQDSPPPGLRERKREQTRRRLETAAVAIVLEDGLDKLTIDALSERAEVSPRTFFNYFDSKEDAILGNRSEDDTRRLVAEVLDDVHADTLVDAVVELLILVGAAPDQDLHDKRHRIIREHPELVHRKFTHIGRLLGPLTDGIRTLIDRLRVTDAAEPRTHQYAEVVLMSCSAALRATYIELAQNGADLATDESTRALREGAAALVHETTGILK